ncbi:MAG: methyltransferase domain-containing protein [Phycisphaerae bacterium]|nr:methyltransferase domain-containing protein [Phycisphaerae bacterium]
MTRNEAVNMNEDRLNGSAEAASRPAWQYDEMKPSGVNYNDACLAENYDTRHTQFRDYRREAEQIMTALGLGASATVIDMGCGTGAFALHAARRYRKVHAVDVSQAMLDLACAKAQEAQLTNIEFHRGGFLTYEHRAEPADGIVSTVALHHLPDFWKCVGLHRLAQMLKPGGRLYLFDVVFSFEIERYETAIAQFISTMSESMGPTGRAEPETHVCDEYSTCHWIMEGMLERAGLKIDTITYMNEFLAGYLCTKKTD